MPTDKESDCVVISPSNGHAINSSQCDNSPRSGQEEIPEREEREDKGELKERPQLHMSEMASDTKEEKLVSTRVKKSISYSKSMDSRSGTSTPAGDSGNGAHRPHNLPLPCALATDKRVTGKPSQPSVSPVGSRNGERVLEKSSSHKIQVCYFSFFIYHLFLFSLYVLFSSKVLFDPTKNLQTGTFFLRKIYY